MGILEWLSGGLAKPGSNTQGDTETVRRIVSELDRLEPTRARYLASFAYVLSRVAGADLHISEAESHRIIELLQSKGHLPEEQAVLVAQIAKSQHQLFSGTENFLVTREFRGIASEEQRRELLDCLFAVSAADHAITGEEEAQISQIASETGMTHAEFVAARLRYSDKRTVLQSRAGRAGGPGRAG